MGQKEMVVTAAGENRIMIFGPKTDGAYVIELIHRVVTWRTRHRLSITHISPRLSADAILRILESDESFVIPS